MPNAEITAQERDVDSRPVLTTLLLVSMLTTMAGAIVAPSLPAMEKHFHTVPHAGLLVRMILTVPGLAIALGAPLAGTLVDRIGRKPVLVSSVALFAVSGSSGLYLNDVYSILAGRLLLGVAVAGIMTATTTLVADLYPEAARSRVLGLQAGFMGFGGVVFLSLGGALADLSWRGPFGIYLVALPLTFLTVLLIREPERSTAAVVTGETGEATGREKFPVLAFGVYGLVIAGQLIFYTVPSQLPFHLAEIAGVGAGGSGLAIALMSLSTALVGLNYGRVSKGRSHRTLAFASFALMAVGFAALGFADGVPLSLVGLLIAGAGVGLVIPNLNTWLMSRTPASLRGRVLGGVTSSLFLGQFISPLISQPVSGSIGIDGVYLAASAFAVVVALAVLAVVREGADDLGGDQTSEGRRPAGRIGEPRTAPGQDGAGTQPATRPLD